MCYSSRKSNIKLAATFINDAENSFPMINMGIFKTALIVLFGLNTLIGFYQTGAYAYGKKEVRSGTKYAIYAGIGAIIDGLILYGLVADW